MNGETDVNEKQEEAPQTGRMSLSSSRGDFIKWSTVAMGGLYVGPKISSFAVDQVMGQAGSTLPTPPPTSTPTPTGPELPPTGGAAVRGKAARRR
jgi:hypothetical protein